MGQAPLPRGFISSFIRLKITKKTDHRKPRRFAENAPPLDSA
jgi:hypothetical protein